MIRRKLTYRLCRSLAREFVAQAVRPGMQWTMRDLRDCCAPAGYYLPDEALYSGPATVADITGFLRANLRRRGGSWAEEVTP